MGEPKAARYPRSFGKYQILREAGRGGRGVVYEATDTVLQRPVALKLTLTGPGADPDSLKKEEERFLVEARIGAHLPKHPHIVGVYEAGEIESQRFLAAEFIEGEPLSLWRTQAGVTLPQQVHLLRDVALAIEHAHRHGVVHRDLKPGNILVDREGQPRVTDFGLAKMAGQAVDLAKAAPGRIWGTPSYMSPEHARGLDTVDARADVYSLGAMLYEILAGHAPFHGVDPADAVRTVVNDPVPPPSGKIPHRALEGLAMKALAKDPAQRPASAKAFADDLTRWLDGQARPTVRRPAPPPKKSPATMLALAGTGIVAAGIVAFALMSGSRAPEPAPPDPAARSAEEERIEVAKRRAADDARREESEKSRQEQERLLREAERRRLASEEETLKQQAFLMAQRRDAEERARKAEEQLKQAAEAAPPKPALPETPLPATPPPVPPPTPPPAPAPRSAPTGDPKALPDGTLHWEAEDYTGGEKAAADRDYHDNSPGNAGRAYRAHDVDLVLSQDGTVWVGAIEPGEWLNFRFEGEGRYEIEVRYIAGQAASFHLEADGVNVTGPLSPPPTAPAAWGTFKSATQRIPAGAHSLRFVFDIRVLGLDWFRLKKTVPAPIPAPAALREAEKTIRALFKADYARKSQSDFQALAQKLLQEGRSEGDPVSKYALLVEARELAEQAADIAAALAVVEELDKVYAVDAAALRQESLAACGRAARTPEAHRALAEAWLALAEPAAAREDFDQAVALAGKAEPSARASQDAGLVSRVQARAKELASLRDDFRPVKAALKTLEEKPDDPAANLAAGSYRCFARNDWIRGLPLLAKGSDAPLAALARKELEGKEDAASLGDAWREAGEKRPAAKARFFARALHWYEKALPGMAGLDKIRVEGQVEALYKSIGGDALKKGLVFWVEPGRDSGDSFRELVFGARSTNTGAQVADAGRALSFGGSFVDYAAPDAVKNVDRAGSIFFWIRNEAPFAAIFNRAEPERGLNDLWLWIQGNVLTLGFHFPENQRRYVSRGAVPTSRWVFCGATWDERSVTFHIDGKEDSVFPIGPNPVFPPRRLSRMRIGAYAVPGSDFRGLAGSVMLYNRALPTPEATQLFMSTRARYR